MSLNLTEHAILLTPDACLQTAVAHVRFVAVSATIPNVLDIAAWLEVPEAGILVFGEEMRPVRLRTIVKGYSPAKNDFLFEKCAALPMLDCVCCSSAACHHAGFPSRNGMSVEECVELQLFQC